jgi:hypothetical protein
MEFTVFWSAIMATTYVPMPDAAATFSSDTYTGGSVPATYDVLLYKPFHEFEQLKLSLSLRINMRQAPPRPLPLILDADDKPYWTLSWTAGDWQNFMNGVTAQAEMWNNKFWLVPPPTFTDYDQSIPSSFPNQVFRPNIRCALDVNFNAAKDPHRTIDVANINMAMIPGGPSNAGTFRSHALLYDALDAVPWAFPVGKGPGNPAKHYVIAHEIGHAIGLGHIGTILKTPLCDFAIAADTVGFHTSLTQGGRNSFYCYGLNQGMRVIGNIMGAGEDFTVDDALPWIWSMMFLRKRQGEYWKAVRNDPGPGTWLHK